MKNFLFLILCIVTLTAYANVERTDVLHAVYTVDGIDFNFDKFYADAEVLKAESNFPILDYQDDIFNPDNHEYLLEVLWNMDVYLTVDNIVDVQYEFTHRYYDTCTENNQQWFKWYRDAVYYNISSH